MRNNEIMAVQDPAPKRLAEHKTKSNLAHVVGEAMGLIACMCVSAIVIALTVKFIMWIL